MDFKLEKYDSQAHNNATFDRLPKSNAGCEIESEENPVDGIKCIYDRDKNDQAYYERKDVCKNHSETNLLKPYNNLQKFRTIYNFQIFDISKQKFRISSEPIGLEFRFSAGIGVPYFAANAHFLTPKLISTRIAGQRRCDLLLTRIKLYFN